MRAGKALTVGLLTLALATSAFGWGGPSHSMLAGNIFNDAAIKPFISEFGINAGAVTSWSDEPPSDWHHPGYSMIVARGYLGTYSGDNWAGLDETTRLRYMTHILMDCGVPINHSPANQVYPGTQVAEGALEAQASTWSDSPNVSGNSYSGTFSQVVSTFTSECVTNAQNFKNSGTEWYLLGAHSTDENRHYGWIGQTLALKFARAVLTDYFLAKRGTHAEAGSGYAVDPNGNVTFSSAGSYDPDSITWRTNATYYNNGGGITSVKWDLDNDGTYETTGSTASKTHAQLVSMIGYTEGKTIEVQVTDNEGKVATDTATVAVYSNPNANAGTNIAVKEGQSVTLAASGNDQDGGSVTVKWDLDGDGTYETANNTTKTHAQLASQVGYTEGKTVKVEVTDNEGKKAIDTTTLAVFSDPFADAGLQYMAEFGKDVTLTASGYDPDGGSIIEWLWDIDGDGQFDDASGTSATFSHADLVEMGLTAGESHTIWLRVKDNDGAYQGTKTDSAILMVEVPEPATLALLSATFGAAIVRRRKRS